MVRRWFGRGKNQFRVRDTGLGTTFVTFQGTTIEVDTAFYLDKRADIDRFKSKEKFFQSLYWGTAEGRGDIEERYRENFATAIGHRFSRANFDKQNQAIAMWESMSPQQRDRFTSLNRVLVESIFDYEEIERREIEDNFDWAADRAQQNTEIDMFIETLKEFAGRSR